MAAHGEPVAGGPAPGQVREGERAGGSVATPPVGTRDGAGYGDRIGGVALASCHFTVNVAGM